MDQTDTTSDELARRSRHAFRRLVRAGNAASDLHQRAFSSDTGLTAVHIDRLKKQLRVEVRLQHTAPWAASPLHYAHVLSQLAALQRSQSARVNRQRPDQRPPPET